MEISRELLKKYALGTCTDRERKAVEDWLSLDEGYENIQYRELFESRKEIIQERIHKRLWPLETRFWNYTKKGLRYSAAACILLVTFLGGRVSAKSNQPTKSIVPELNEGLYIIGGNGAYGELPGERFRLEFDGRLRLFNASKTEQTIMVGDSIFGLDQGRAFILTGSTKMAEISAVDNNPIRDKKANDTEGDFSLLRLDR